jgi:triphosphoribosyl-dephospho-CoA synthase
MTTLADHLERACLLEATARKPGNVHPGAAFDDLCYDDFVRAAQASAPVLAQTHELGLGRAVFAAVEATQAVTTTNVNLGICLLLAPLAAGASEGNLWCGARRRLNESTVADTEEVYRAIRLAHPGGLGEVSSEDVASAPTLTIPQVMSLAAERDAIACELSSGFCELERHIVPFLKWVLQGATGGPLQPLAMPDGVRATDWELAVVLTHLLLISHGDTLIRRKCGDAVCQEAAERASQLLHPVFVTGQVDAVALTEFDRWLRADGHRRNPGTSADLIAAALFAGLVEGWLPAPSREELARHARCVATRA